MARYQLFVKEILLLWNILFSWQTDLKDLKVPPGRQGWTSKNGAIKVGNLQLTMMNPPSGIPHHCLAHRATGNSNPEQVMPSCTSSSSSLWIVWGDARWPTKIPNRTKLESFFCSATQSHHSFCGCRNFFPWLHRNVFLPGPLAGGAIATPLMGTCFLGAWPRKWGLPQESTRTRNHLKALRSYRSESLCYRLDVRCKIPTTDQTNPFAAPMNHHSLWGPSAFSVH